MGNKQSNPEGSKKNNSNPYMKSNISEVGYIRPGAPIVGVATEVETEEPEKDIGNKLYHPPIIIPKKEEELEEGELEEGDDYSQQPNYNFSPLSEDESGIPLGQPEIPFSLGQPEKPFSLSPNQNFVASNKSSYKLSPPLLEDFDSPGLKAAAGINSPGFDLHSFDSQGSKAAGIGSQGSKAVGFSSPDSQYSSEIPLGQPDEPDESQDTLFSLSQNQEFKDSVISIQLADAKAEAKADQEEILDDDLLGPAIIPETDDKPSEILPIDVDDTVSDQEQDQLSQLSQSQSLQVQQLEPYMIMFNSLKLSLLINTSYSFFKSLRPLIKLPHLVNQLKTGLFAANVCISRRCANQFEFQSNINDIKSLITSIARDCGLLEDASDVQLSQSAPNLAKSFDLKYLPVSGISDPFANRYYQSCIISCDLLSDIFSKVINKSVTGTARFRLDLNDIPSIINFIMKGIKIPKNFDKFPEYTVMIDTFIQLLTYYTEIPDFPTTRDLNPNQIYQHFIGGPFAKIFSGLNVQLVKIDSGSFIPSFLLFNQDTKVEQKINFQLANLRFSFVFAKLQIYLSSTVYRKSITCLSLNTISSGTFPFSVPFAGIYPFSIVEVKNNKKKDICFGISYKSKVKVSEGESQQVSDLCCLLTGNKEILFSNALEASLFTLSNGTITINLAKRADLLSLIPKTFGTYFTIQKRFLSIIETKFFESMTSFSVNVSDPIIQGQINTALQKGFRFNSAKNITSAFYKFFYDRSVQLTHNSYITFDDLLNTVYSVLLKKGIRTIGFGGGFCSDLVAAAINQFDLPLANNPRADDDYKIFDSERLGIDPKLFFAFIPLIVETLLKRLNRNKSVPMPRCEIHYGDQNQYMCSIPLDAKISKNFRTSADTFAADLSASSTIFPFKYNGCLEIAVNDECALADLDQVVMEENKYEEYARELLGNEYQVGCFDKIIEISKTDDLITTEYANMRGYAFDIFLIFYIDEQLLNREAKIQKDIIKWPTALIITLLEMGVTIEKLVSYSDTKNKGIFSNDSFICDSIDFMLEYCPDYFTDVIEKNPALPSVKLVEEWPMATITRAKYTSLRASSASPGFETMKGKMQKIVKGFLKMPKINSTQLCELFIKADLPNSVSFPNNKNINPGKGVTPELYGLVESKIDILIERFISLKNLDECYRVATDLLDLNRDPAPDEDIEGLAKKMHDLFTQYNANSSAGVNIRSRKMGGATFHKKGRRSLKRKIIKKINKNTKINKKNTKKRSKIYKKFKKSRKSRK